MEQMSAEELPRITVRSGSCTLHGEPAPSYDTTPIPGPAD